MRNFVRVFLPVLVLGLAACDNNSTTIRPRVDQDCIIGTWEAEQTFTDPSGSTIVSTDRLILRSNGTFETTNSQTPATVGCDPFIYVSGTYELRGDNLLLTIRTFLVCGEPDGDIQVDPVQIRCEDNSLVIGDQVFERVD